jgi:hypothetical protein
VKIVRSRVYYAEGKGVFMTKDDSNETATWTGQEIAHYSGRKRRDVGSVFCSTSSSTTGKLGFLNNVVGVFEYEVDENGNSGGKIWEWKSEEDSCSCFLSNIHVTTF